MSIFNFFWIFQGRNRRGGNRGNRSGTFGTVRKGTEYGR